MTVVIPLTKGYETVVDDEDADLADGRRWCTQTSLHNLYALNRTVGRMHRIILERKLGRALLDTEQVDHMDGDSLNNRRANLRLATSFQNAQNAKRQRNNSSGFKGVDYYPPSDQWRARIAANGVRLFLGYYDTPEDAHEAYCTAARELHGEFARTR